MHDDRRPGEARCERALYAMPFVEAVLMYVGHRASPNTLPIN